jgi:hypothetical protein
VKTTETIDDAKERLLDGSESSDRLPRRDYMTGFREKPNCTALLKSPESPRVAHTFNNCGYRTVEPCGPKPPGVIRIALLGSSIAEGYLVPYPDTFAVQAAGVLTSHDHRQVERPFQAAMTAFEPALFGDFLDAPQTTGPDAAWRACLK